jgi:ElaA protein
MTSSKLHWRLARFDELGVDDLYAALALRCRVFVLEQGPYLDPDGKDQHSAHLLCRDGGPAGPLVAYLRIVDPGLRFDEPSIGRVITAPEVRGTGLGRTLMKKGIETCRMLWPAQGIRISAQARLEDFYQSMGFITVGEPYGEDTIPHVEMLLPETQQEKS